jgi:hypothetical protein
MIPRECPEKTETCWTIRLSFLDSYGEANTEPFFFTKRIGAIDNDKIESC